MSEDRAGLPEKQAAARRVLEAARRRFGGREPRIVLIDGRSGSGKTTLARELATLAGSAQTLQVEDLYPGWEGLATGADTVAEVLKTGRYRRYDWHERAFTDEVRLGRGEPIIVEGCGAISAANLMAARSRAQGLVWAVWAECPSEVRRARALARDGEAYRPYWSQWAAQEEHRIAQTLPLAHAHSIVHTDAWAGRVGHG